MAKGKRKRKAPSQCGAHSADELSNASNEEDIVLLSQPCSSVTSVSSPAAGRYIPRFSNKKPKLAKCREQHVATPLTCASRFTPQKTAVVEAFPSEPEAGLEDTGAYQLVPQHAASSEENESKLLATQEKPLAVALKKSCANRSDPERTNSLTSPVDSGREKTASDAASEAHAPEDNVAGTAPVGTENENGTVFPAANDSGPLTEKQVVPVARDTTQGSCTTAQDTKAEPSKEPDSETIITKLNQFCDLLGDDSDDEEISLQPFLSQQFGRTKKPLQELPLSQPAVHGHVFCTPGLALSQAFPVAALDTTLIAKATVVDEEEEASSRASAADGNDEHCMQHVPTLQTCGGGESTRCEPLEGGSAHDDRFMEQLETADVGLSLPLIQPVGDNAAVPCCSGDGGLNNDGSQGGVVPDPLGDREGLSLYQGVGEAEGKQEVGGEKSGLQEEAVAADPLLDSLMEEDCVDIDVCQLESQLQLESHPGPLPAGSVSTPNSKGTPKRMNVDTEEMHLEVCSGSSSVSFGREGEAAGLDDSGIKLLQGILTELSSLNCFVMACRRELEASKRQRRQWLRTARQQQQRK